MSYVTVSAADGGSFQAYHAKPASGTGPGILLIQEIFGVNKVMRDLAEGFAAEGYHVLCPDIFWRIEPGIDITDQTEAEWARAFELFQAFDVDKGMDDLKSTLSALRDLDGCTGKAGSVGYCLGGKLAYMMAVRSDADCNVSYYGVGLDELIGEAGNISSPYLSHIASKDQFVPKEAQAVILDGLAGIEMATVHVYDGNDHAFARVGGEHYDRAAAELANGRTRDFFRAHLN